MELKKTQNMSAKNNETGTSIDFLSSNQEIFMDKYNTTNSLIMYYFCLYNNVVSWIIILNSYNLHLFVVVYFLICILTCI